MYAVIELPHLPLQAGVLEWGAGARKRQPVAILDNGEDRVIDLNRAARTAGVESGASAARARARCAALELLPRRMELECELHERLLDLAAGHSPDIESTGPGVVTMDLAHRPPPPLRHVEKVLGQLHGERLRARAGLADEPDPALLAAALGRPVFELARDAPGRERQLADRPVGILPLERSQRDVLELWGVRTLGELASLPSEGLVERLGPEALRLRSLARGRGSRLLRLHRPPEALREILELEAPIDRLEPLLFLLRRLLDTLLARVIASWRCVESLGVDLQFEDGTEHRGRLPLATAGCDPALLTRVLQAHLETLHAPAPVTGLILEIEPGESSPAQRDLFHRDLRAPTRFGETLARLQARLGEDAVGCPRLGEDHRPDHFKLGAYPLDQSCVPTEQAATGLMALPGPPLRRFRPPRPILVECDPAGRPLRLKGGDGGPRINGAVRCCRGPWILSGHWWDREEWQMTEWDVQLAADGPVYRLVRGSGGWRVSGVYD